MPADRYAIEPVQLDGLSAWTLSDDAADLHATWVPPAGMLGASLIHRGEELLYIGEGVSGYVDARAFMGVPFLYPWANRLRRFGYRLDGHDVELDPSSPRLLLDDNGLPIHGVLTASPDWSVRETVADGDGAHLVAGLSFDRPDLLAAFPFPHQIEMAVALSDGALQVRTTIVAAEVAVPVAFGFHPYLDLPGAPRQSWTVDLPVRRRLLHDERMLPTGVSTPVEPITGAIGPRTWDDGFDRLDTPTRFRVRAAQRTVDVEFVAGYPVAQVFAPPGERYLCIEPMTAPVDALDGPAEGLTWVDPGQRWSATFRIHCALD